MFKKKKKTTIVPEAQTPTPKPIKKEVKEEVIDFGDFDPKKSILPEESPEIERTINGMDEIIIDQFVEDSFDEENPEETIAEPLSEETIIDVKPDEETIMESEVEEVELTNTVIENSPTVENQNELVDEEIPNKKRKKKDKKAKKENNKKKKKKKSKKDKDLQAIKDRKLFKFKKRKYTKVEDFIKYLNAHYLDIDEISKEVLESEYFLGWLSKNSGKYPESVKEMEKIKEKIEK